MKALLTKRSLVLLLKGALAQRLETKRACEMLRMKFLIHSGDTSTIYGHLTARAETTTLQVIVQLAIWHVLVLEKACRIESRTTILFFVREIL